MLRRWVNDSEFAGAVRLHPQSKDPLIGTQDRRKAFRDPSGDGGPPIKVTGLSTFVTTKAAAYVFLPSITAIKYRQRGMKGRRWPRHKPGPLSTQFVGCPGARRGECTFREQLATVLAGIEQYVTNSVAA